MKYMFSQLLEFVKLMFFFRLNKFDYWRHLGVRIGSDCEILIPLMGFGTEPWLIEIGSNVTVAPKVSFITHDASTRLFRHQLSHTNQLFGNEFGTIRILNSCFIGMNAIILPNVTIGPNAIVGAGSVVTKSVPPNTIVAGNPAKSICSLDEYSQKCIERMIPVLAKNRKELRQELTKYFWKEQR
jgi:acetyltransferase-like isoleucine patch superfamily enzyme